ncbi:uncharacterized protein [Asterias amurensis]|uniref:uncharacterized protein n=1 Tax=Asterias amurensis TaxID=7602 RepID=UPI003AB7A709
MYSGDTQHPLLYLFTLVVGILIFPNVTSLELCDAPTCNCLNSFFGPIYLSVSCDVSSPDFDFAQFSIVTEFPSEPYELELRNNAQHSREPFVVPPDAFVAFAHSSSSSPSSLGFYLIDNFAPLSRGSLRGLEIQHVTFSGSAMNEFPSEALRDVSHSLLSITVYNIVSVDGTAITFPPVHSLDVLERVTIEYTRVASSTSLMFTNLPSLRQLEITASNSGTIRTLLLVDLPSLRSLDLSGNNLMVMPSTLSGLKTLKYLDLSDNNIKSLDANLLSKLPELAKIDVQANKIETVDRAVLEVLTDLTNLRALSLRGNPFDCRCDMLPFIRWLREASLDIGPGNVFCKYPLKFSKIELTSPDLVSALETNCSEVVTEKLLMGTTSSVTSPDSVGLLQTTKKGDDVSPRDDFGPPQYHVIVPIVIVLAVLSAAVIASSLILHKKLKRRCFVFFRRHSTESGSRQHSINSVNFIEVNRIYDAYVCHHDSMAEFVALTMVPKLEQEPHNLQLCVSFRDFLVGVDNLDNVSSAMNNSRATIVLLNREFITSGQCLLELNMACSQMVASVDSVTGPGDGASLVPGSETRLLLVLMDALPVEDLPATLRALRDKITCLKWDTKDEDRCWGQLQRALLARR